MPCSYSHWCKAVPHRHCSERFSSSHLKWQTGFDPAWMSYAFHHHHQFISRSPCAYVFFCRSEPERHWMCWCAISKLLSLAFLWNKQVSLWLLRFECCWCIFIFLLLINGVALNCLHCAEVLLKNYSLTHLSVEQTGVCGCFASNVVGIFSFFFSWSMVWH